MLTARPLPSVSVPLAQIPTTSLRRTMVSLMLMLSPRARMPTPPGSSAVVLVVGMVLSVNDLLICDVVRDDVDGGAARPEAPYLANHQAYIPSLISDAPVEILDAAGTTCTPAFDRDVGGVLRR